MGLIKSLFGSPEPKHTKANRGNQSRTRSNLNSTTPSHGEPERRKHTTSDKANRGKDPSATAGKHGGSNPSARRPKKQPIREAPKHDPLPSELHASDITGPCLQSTHCPDLEHAQGLLQGLLGGARDFGKQSISDIVDAYAKAFRESYVDWEISEADQEEAYRVCSAVMKTSQEVVARDLQGYLGHRPEIDSVLAHRTPEFNISLKLLQYLCYMARCQQRDLPGFIKSDFSLMSVIQQAAYRHTANHEGSDIKGSVVSLERRQNPWEYAEHGLSVLLCEIEKRMPRRGGKERGPIVAAEYLEHWMDNFEPLDEMFRVAPSRMLADVVVAFEAVCRFHPSAKPQAEEEKLADEEMKLLKLFFQNVLTCCRRHYCKLQDLFDDCARRVPKVRRPQLLVFFLSTEMMDKETAESFVSSLITLHGTEYREQEGKYMQEDALKCTVIGLITTYGLAEAQRCLEIGIPCHAFTLIYRVLIHSSFEDVFELVLQTFQADDKLSQAVKANITLWAATKSLGPFGPGLLSETGRAAY
ncbi:MAG: hypothetical protein M1816_002675 [Peltula sp. TS41687]|nr:MAG: hypothetical protein M1816_002675 [Peltula sp. TS41687]